MDWHIPDMPLAVKAPAYSDPRQALESNHISTLGSVIVPSSSSVEEVILVCLRQEVDLASTLVGDPETGMDADRTVSNFHREVANMPDTKVTVNYCQTGQAGFVLQTAAQQLPEAHISSAPQK